MNQKPKYKLDDFVKYIGPVMVGKHLHPNAIYKVSEYHPDINKIYLRYDNYGVGRSYNEELFVLYDEPSFKKGDLIECVGKSNHLNSVEIGIIYEAAFDSNLQDSSYLPEEFVTLTEDETLARFVQYPATMFVKRDILSDEDLDVVPTEEPPMIDLSKELENNILTQP